MWWWLLFHCCLFLFSHLEHTMIALFTVVTKQQKSNIWSFNSTLIIDVYKKTKKATTGKYNVFLIKTFVLCFACPLWNVDFPIKNSDGGGDDKNQAGKSTVLNIWHRQSGTKRGVWSVNKRNVQEFTVSKQTHRNRTRREKWWLEKAKVVTGSCNCTHTTAYLHCRVRWKNRKRKGIVHIKALSIRYILRWESHLVNTKKLKRHVKMQFSKRKLFTDASVLPWQFFPHFWIVSLSFVRDLFILLLLFPFIAFVRACCSRTSMLATRIACMHSYVSMYVWTV